MRVRACIAGVDEDSAVGFYAVIQAITIGIRGQRIGPGIGATHKDVGCGLDSVNSSPSESGSCRCRERLRWSQIRHYQCQSPSHHSQSNSREMRLPTLKVNQMNFTTLSGDASIQWLRQLSAGR